MKVRVVREQDYVPAHLRRGPMKFAELEVSETVSKTGRKNMKFSEVIAALEDGKKVRPSGIDGDYYQVVAPGDGLNRQLVYVYKGGSWENAELRFSGHMRNDWTVVDS
jgi:hypothetical protein